MPGWDAKSERRDLYQPGAAPAIVEVPAMRFLTVHGTGGPGSPAYARAVEALYSLAYTIKMSKMGSDKPEGYVEYVVPPLEGLWWFPGEDAAPVGDVVARRDDLSWIALIRQPEFVTPAVFGWACAAVRAKKPGVDVGGAALEEFEEGRCAQVRHIGPYATEAATVAVLDEFIVAQGYRTDMSGWRQHHEIYLGDPRRTAPDKLKTVLRHPIARA